MNNFFIPLSVNFRQFMHPSDFKVLEPIYPQSALHAAQRSAIIVTPLIHIKSIHNCKASKMISTCDNGSIATVIVVFRSPNFIR